MSLTRFLERSDIRAHFRQEFPKPKMTTAAALLVPPQSQRYGLIGTAFDYLLRFHVQRLNPKAIHRRWVAEDGFFRLGLRATGQMHYDVDTEVLSFPDDDGVVHTARSVLTRAKAAHERFLKSGKVTDALLRSAIGLAQLDTVFRSGFVDENLGSAHRDDMRDLRKLIALVSATDFRARSVCVLNPSFGIGSRLMRGADADLLIDGMLIEIKTIKKLELARDYLNQLLSYLAMYEIWGANGLKRKITKLAVYFARHASMQVFEVKDIVRNTDFPKFVKWFGQEVEQYGAREVG
jgi:hypothetical protein